jgi:hypothetical protein
MSLRALPTRETLTDDQFAKQLDQFTVKHGEARTNASKFNAKKVLLAPTRWDSNDTPIELTSEIWEQVKELARRNNVGFPTPQLSPQAAASFGRAVGAALATEPDMDPALAAAAGRVAGMCHEGRGLAVTPKPRWKG